jgi:hypothetical protein
VVTPCACRELVSKIPKKQRDRIDCINFLILRN